MDNDGLLVFELTLLYSDNNCYLSLLPVPIFRNIIDEVIRNIFKILPFMKCISGYGLYYDDINGQFIGKYIKFDMLTLKQY